MFIKIFFKYGNRQLCPIQIHTVNTEEIIYTKNLNIYHFNYHSPAEICLAKKNVLQFKKIEFNENYMRFTVYTVNNFYKSQWFALTITIATSIFDTKIKAVYLGKCLIINRIQVTWVIDFYGTLVGIKFGL